MKKEKRERKAFDPVPVLNGHSAGQSRLRLPADHIIYKQGDPADSLFYVESGWVKLCSVALNGKEAVAAPRGPGEYFGTRSLIEPPRTATATTLTECSLVRVTNSALIRMLYDEPGFAEMFTLYLVRQSLRDAQSIIGHLTASAEQRLARALLELADRCEQHGAISTPINQALLAGMVGTTRSRISLFMNKFRRLGFVEYDRNGYLNVRPSLQKALLDV
jgi:CRP-like cAMP-binding protein